jgi:hypothetical protein
MAWKADNGAVPTSGRKPVSRRLIHSLLSASIVAATMSALLAATPDTAKVYGGAERDVPLARFQDAVCPGIIGVQRDSAEAMVGLIRQNAADLGLRLGDPDTCEPNLLVAVLDDPGAYLGDLRKRRPYLFEGMAKGELQALFATPGPAHTWTRVLTYSRDGLPVYQTDSLTDPPWTTMMAAHSLIYVPTRRDIITSMVLIDKKAVQGMSVAQVADYATMRGLSGHQGERLEAPGNTILGLFGASARPAGLTRSDKIFLQTLYSTMPNDPAAITLSLADARIAGDQAVE